MIDGVSVQQSEATDSSVRVTLVAEGGSDLAGEWELYGPTCEYARTLASTFRGRAIGGGNVQFLVTEPCYWSPAMPFLYEVRRVDSDGQTHSLGLRQLIAHGRNLRLGGERVVLRGTACGTLQEEVARRAHAAESAVFVASVADADLAAASRLGTSVLAQANEFGSDLATLVAKLSWQPAAAALLLARNQFLALAKSPLPRCGILIGQRFDARAWGDANAIVPGADFIVAMLEDGERPPEWMATCGRPVVAVRYGATYDDFGDAREACDRVQAELAPTFDLAGYFSGAVNK